MAKHKTTPPLTTTFILLSLIFLSTSLNSDKQTLLSLKQTLKPPPPLLSNWNQTTPLSSFHGVTTSSSSSSTTSSKLVTKLILQNLNLTGPFPTQLLSLTSLRVLSLKHNSFSGQIPSQISKLSNLKQLFLSHNDFSGNFPPSLTSLLFIYRLDLSFNSLSGELPSSINRFTHLLTLRLEGNNFSGGISGVSISSLQEFNVSGNRFSGEIPTLLSNFSVTCFLENDGLCGGPLLPCSGPIKPGNPGPNPGVTISSTPSALPGKPYPKKPGKARMGVMAIIAIIVGDLLVLLMIGILLYCCFWRKKFVVGKKGNIVISSGEKVVYSSSPYRGIRGGGSEEGRMVFMEGVRRFELEDLLRASAEMLGKGVFGTVYKAVLDEGVVVAVKRLKEFNVGGGGKKEFEELMEVLGRLRHVHLVGLKAYYFARDEKLLVFDYLPNGSLFWLLHGNRGPGRTPLDWTTRLKIAAGAARGVAFIHNSCRELKLIHGNIKSTNILIDKTGEACVSDFGLSSFSPTSSNNLKSNGYRAPETLDGRRLTQKADVYSFGVLLLELLTGKYPSVVEGTGPYGTIGVGGVVDLPQWVQSVVREEWTAEVFDLELMRYKDIEEEMVALLQIAMVCTSSSAEQRPRMGHVVKMIEEIRGLEASPAHDNFDSDSPCVSEDTSH